MVGEDLGRGTLDINVCHRKDALFGCAWDLSLIPVLVHLPYHNYSLTLHTKKDMGF